MHVISVCLTDIPKENITKANNGKSYVSLVVDKKKETDAYGNTHTVYISQTKEERQRKEKKTFVGNGKEFNFENKDSGATDDLPWQ